MRHHRLERAKRVFGDDVHGVFVDDVDALDGQEQAPPIVALLRVEHAIEVGFHRLRVEGRAILKLHTRSQMERPRHVVGGHRPAFGEIRHKLHVLVIADERVEQHPDDLVGLRVGRVVRVERRSIGARCEDEAVTRLAFRTGQREPSGEAESTNG